MSRRLPWPLTDAGALNVEGVVGLGEQGRLMKGPWRQCLGAESGHRAGGSCIDGVHGMPPLCPPSPSDGSGYAGCGCDGVCSGHTPVHPHPGSPDPSLGPGGHSAANGHVYCSRRWLTGHAVLHVGHIPPLQVNSLSRMLQGGLVRRSEGGGHIVLVLGELPV